MQLLHHHVEICMSLLEKTPLGWPRGVFCVLEGMGKRNRVPDVCSAGFFFSDGGGRRSDAGVLWM